MFRDVGEEFGIIHSTSGEKETNVIKKEILAEWRENKTR